MSGSGGAARTVDDLFYMFRDGKAARSSMGVPCVAATMDWIKAPKR
jgi:hypothetical protein